MSDTNSPVAIELSPSLGHLTVRPEGEPAEVHFLFEQQEKRLGGAIGASIISHIAFVLLAVLIVRMAREAAPQAFLQDRSPNEIIWLVEPGPGGGGGGGGNRMPEPPKKAELPGKEKLSVPAVPAATPQIEEIKPEEPQPDQNLTIPAKTMAAALTTSPGALESTLASEVSQGSGVGGGAGTGTGTGSGPGQGSGLGPGSGGGTGGGAYRPGNGVEIPKLISQIRPNYTAEAMRAKVQGIVVLECVVLPTGTVGHCSVKRSLDQVFGLDDEALRAVKQWRFLPGTRFGEPVAVLVSIELSFTLR
jgi:TonB family protein